MDSNETHVKSNAERQSCYRADKLFKILPLDVQRSIDRLSSTPEEKAQRTAIALDYQGKMGKRMNTGMDCRQSVNSALPGDEDYQPHTGLDEHCNRVLCNRVLPRLEQPRQYQGTCQLCVSAR